MSSGDYLYEAHQTEIDRLRRQINHLQSENTDLKYRLCDKEDRILELEDALDSTRRELRNVQDGYHLDRAKRHGRNAVGGWW